MVVRTVASTSSACASGGRCRSTGVVATGVIATGLAVYGMMPYIAIIRAAAKRELKTERMELRVSPSARRVIEKATAISGLAAGDLAYEAARRVVEDHDRMVLRGDDREAFLNAIANPPRPVARLVAAIRKHRKLGV
jgi:uncharacterized protein (DUF1778 family)